jgi:type IV pilus assembly protein PilY1
MFRPRSACAAFVQRLVCTGLAVFWIGALNAPAWAAVTVDQAPLTVQAPLPPNVVLMLDDSGSMAYDYMPDNLSDSSQNGFWYSGVNGTYYNPAVTYKPPLKADGSSYPNSPGLGNAYNDGFQDATATDVTRYTGGKAYFTRFQNVVINAYAPTATCPLGWTLQTSGTRAGQCRNNIFGTYQAATLSCNSGDSIGSGGQCEIKADKYVFTYTTVVSNSYKLNYVAKTGDCDNLSATAKAACTDSATAQQNVANWFSYYRTRMLMAKSGVMNAFAGVSPNFRIGFGDINNGNKAGLGSGSDVYQANSTPSLAVVKPFGDGSSGTQKAKLWSWLANVDPDGGTPLRPALQAVGEYYKTTQPWATSSSDSTELACRQSYTILTTDGFWNGGAPSNVGDQDGVAGPTITGPNNQSFTYNPNAPFADSAVGAVTSTYDSFCPDNSWSGPNVYSGSSLYRCRKGPANNRQYTAPVCRSGDRLSSTQGSCSNVTTAPNPTYSDTLADVAMEYWQTDLRPNSSNQVPTNAVDVAFWQHMATFTLGLGFDPTGISPAGTTVEQISNWARPGGGTAPSGFSWPKPSSDSQNNIADLAHAAINGRGTFSSAKTPQDFASALQAALATAGQRVGTGASLAANSTQLQTGTVAYQANYYTGRWVGDLKAFAINSTNGDIATGASWIASSVLPAAASRTIWTYNQSGNYGSGNNGGYKSFVNASATTPPAGLNATQLTALGSDGAAQALMVSYLRGDATKEQRNNGTFRDRDTPLGDIVNSQPVYVGAPDPNQFVNQTFSGSSTYATFATGTTNGNNFTASAASTRTQVVYVAANDGMLHGFNASTGVEVFAYLPGAVLATTAAATKLSNLADPTYGSASLPHQFYNDGELTVADAYNGSNWRTVLVGSTGRGPAKAVYALDITDPSNVTLLWERSSGDGGTNAASIGQIIGKPVIAQTANGQWSALVGNGLNSTNGRSALLQFNLFDGTLSVHATGDATTDNGLAASSAWMDNASNGISTKAYAGDLRGQVWSFVLNDGTTTNGGSTPASTGTLLYTAKNASNTVQPITAGMLAGKDPATGNVWLFFGTGKYLTSTDLSNFSTQSWYGLIVQSATANLVSNLSSQGRTALVQRSIVAETAGSAGNPSATPPVLPTLPARVISTAAAGDMNGKSGWYIDLLKGGSVAEGERIVVPNQFQGNLLLGTTRIPLAADACNPSGRGWVMAIDPFTGANPSQGFFDLNGDGNIDAADMVTVGGQSYAPAGIGFSSLPNAPIFTGNEMLMSFDNGTTSSIHTSGSTSNARRVSWRELVNP